MLVRCSILFVWFQFAGLTHAAEQSFQLIHSASGLSQHKEMYMLPVTHSSEYDGLQSEAVFQISAKHGLFETDFYFAYTQISFWQAYDYKNSAPFRDTNYNPELFYRLSPFDYLSGDLGADAGFEHESNGQRIPLSRSWNLLYLSPHYQRDNLLLYIKLRYRIPESEKETPTSTEGDDNPDITDYLGHSDFHLLYRPWLNHQIHFLARGVTSGKGNYSVRYSFPVPKSPQSFLVVHLAHGYGESMMDYNRSINRIGLGLMFTR